MRLLAAWLVAGALGLLVGASAAEAGVRRARLERGLTAVMAGERLYLEVAPLPGESVVGLAKRVSASADAARQLAKANGNVKLLRADLEYRVPFAMLTPSLQVRALRALFPADKLDAQGWRHKTRGEGLWAIAQWFLGDGAKFATIRKANRLKDDPGAGTEVLVPRKLLPSAFLAAATEPVAPPPGKPPIPAVTTAVARGESARPQIAAPAPTKSAASDSAARPALAAGGGAKSTGDGSRAPVLPAAADDAATPVVAPAATPAAGAPLAAKPVSGGNAMAERAPAAAPRSGSAAPFVGDDGSAKAASREAHGASEVPAAESRGAVVSPPLEPLPVAAPGALVSPPLDEPAAVLRAAPQSEASPTAPSSEAPAPSSPYRLSFGRDAQGDYAVYELRPGEALYSSVVVRFTGRTLAEDVNSLALEVAKRNGIDDVTSIAIGYPVKIPLDLLQPEFLPPGHPRRVEYEAALSASSKFRNQVTALDLEGITVVLDAGHGGIDTGASIGGVWESTYVYDIALRVKNLLEQYTAARVVPTTRDGDRFRLEDRDVLSYSRARAVLTSPVYPIQDTKVGVNLRWYIANSVERAAAQNGADPERIVFVSIHADSLHPSLHGAMVYIPDAAMSGDAFERGGPEYVARREVREAPSGDQSRRDRVRSEGLSRELASYMVRAMKSEGLGVDPFKPIRERVIRNRKEWVPAVLRYNVVPAKVLVEVCNLGNNDDRAAIQTRAFRQQMAEAIVHGIRDYYGKTGAASAATGPVKARR